MTPTTATTSTMSEKKAPRRELPPLICPPDDASDQGPRPQLQQECSLTRFPLIHTPLSRLPNQSVSTKKHVNNQQHPKTPTLHRRNDFWWIVIGSFLLCFNAGFINNLTLSSMHTVSASHTTGMIARLSTSLATRDWATAASDGVAYLCFLLGTIVSGTVVRHESFYLGRSYGRVFFSIAVVLTLAIILENAWHDCIYFVWACALACGIQNALTSKYSGNVVRTTHLTGSTTDMGLAIGHILQGRRDDEWWQVLMSLNFLVGFLAGGLASHFAFQEMQHLALLINIIIATFCGLVHTLYIAYHENLGILDVLEAADDIKIHHQRMMGPRRTKFTFEHSPRTGRLHHHHHHHQHHHLHYVNHDIELGNLQQSHHHSWLDFTTAHKSHPVNDEKKLDHPLTSHHHHHHHHRHHHPVTMAATAAHPIRGAVPLAQPCAAPVLVDDAMDIKSSFSSLTSYDITEAYYLPPEGEKSESEDGDEWWSDGDQDDGSSWYHGPVEDSKEYRQGQERDTMSI